MGWCLIFAAESFAPIDALMAVVYVLMVVLGIGLLIFVHELGHFAVAKLCGVQVDKFYLGFDVAGWKLFHFKWGETEYGIGAIPLGGYVKMLGQEDNPARIREEYERAQAKADEGDEKAEPPADEKAKTADKAESGDKHKGDDPDGDDEIDLETAKQALFNPRSYLAKSVPKRMAIISAGVAMNVVLSFVLAVIAFLIGVTEITSGVGSIVPGEAAWKANIRAGDEIKSIGGKPVKRFFQLQQGISLGDVNGGIPLVLHRPGEGEVRVVLKPDQKRENPTIGVGNPLEPVLAEGLAVAPGSPAAEVRPVLVPGDRVVTVGGKPVANMAELHRLLAASPDVPLPFTFERKTKEQPAPERFEVRIPPMPRRWLGLVMTIGPIAAVQADSPAERAGLQPGDVIRTVTAASGFRWDGDPMTLPEQLRKLAETADRVEMTATRPGQAQPVKLSVPLRPVDRSDDLILKGTPLAVPAIGAAYQVEAKVQRVENGSEAERKGIRSGDVVKSVVVVAPDQATQDKYGWQQGTTSELPLADYGWQWLADYLQRVLSESQVKLTLEGGRTVTLSPVPGEGAFVPERGLRFAPHQEFLQADSLGEAVAWGGQETRDSLTMVLRFLKGVGTGQVSPGGVVSPFGLLFIAYMVASQGLGKYLLFLSLLSANLAVVNFLPIPVLDGGHMVFLLYEGIRRKPPSVKVFTVLTYIGLALILSLLLFAMWNDVSRFAAWFLNMPS